MEYGIRTLSPSQLAGVSVSGSKVQQRSVEHVGSHCCCEAKGTEPTLQTQQKLMRTEDVSDLLQSATLLKIKQMITKWKQIPKKINFKD